MYNILKKSLKTLVVFLLLVTLLNVPTMSLIGNGLLRVHDSFYNPAYVDGFLSPRYAEGWDQT